MARYVVDLACALTILEEGWSAVNDHEILAPTLLRSQMLDHLFRQARLGEVDDTEALSLNTRFGKLKFRYLGDAVLRRRAWAIATQLAMTSTFDAEYIALTELQADALVAGDPQLAHVAKHCVPVVSCDALRRAGD